MQTSLVRVSKEIVVKGYVLDTESMNSIDGIALSSISSNESEDDKINKKYKANFKSNDSNVEFSNIESLEAHIKQNRLVIQELELSYSRSISSAINIEFKSNGLVNISAFGDRPDFQFNVDRIEREIKALDQEFPWFVGRFILSDVPRRLVSLILWVSSVWLTYNIFYYFRAQSIGVNIDPGLVISDNSYYTEVESAILSDSIPVKLNVLLRGQLKGFVNANDFIESAIDWIGITLAIMLVGGVVLVILSSLRKLYPLSFVAIGPGIEELSGLKKRREVWLVAILIAFIINVFAGLIVALAI